MNHTLRNSPVVRPFNSLLLLGILCLSASNAFAQNVIRGTTPGWPGNTAYYAPQNVYQLAPNGVVPVMQTQYAPQPGQTSYYAPAAATRIAYAVPAAGSYQVTYSGANQPGLATTAYYGGFNPPVQRVAYYAPQQVYYAPAAPVQYYRPVIAYQPAVVAPAPAVAVPQTCGYSSCQKSTSCGSSCWRPFAWLWGSSCSSNSCSKPVCGSQPCGAAAVPYYTPGPAIPVVPGPGAVIPSSPFRSSTVSPGVIGGTVPPPATRSPGTIITSPPASTVPRLDPGTTIPSNPAPVAPPTFNPAPFTPSPSFGPPAPGAFRPTFSDSYSQPAPATDAPVMLQPPPPSSTINPSGYRSTTERTNVQLPVQGPSTITEPGLSLPPSSVQPLRDPHGDERNRNRAPQLLSPAGDRTAKAGQRWAVVPAVWPVKANEVQPVVKATPELTPVAPQTQLDDGGWKSAR